MLAPDSDTGLLYAVAPQCRQIDARRLQSLFYKAPEQILADHADKTNLRAQSRQIEGRNGARSTQRQAAALRQLLFLKLQLRDAVNQQVHIGFACHHAVEIRHACELPAPRA